MKPTADKETEEPDIDKQNQSHRLSNQGWYETSLRAKNKQFLYHN